MHFFKLWVTVVLSVFASSASSLCWVCDEEIVLTGEQARCFLEKYDLVEKAIVAEPDGYRLINFAACANDTIDDFMFRGPGQLVRPDLPTTGAPSDVPDTTSMDKFAYILDMQSAGCLRAGVEAQIGYLDPNVSVDLMSCERQ